VPACQWRDGSARSNFGEGVAGGISVLPRFSASLCVHYDKTTNCIIIQGNVSRPGILNISAITPTPAGAVRTACRWPLLASHPIFDIYVDTSCDCEPESMTWRTIYVSSMWDYSDASNVLSECRMSENTVVGRQYCRVGRKRSAPLSQHLSTLPCPPPPCSILIFFTPNYSRIV
jgi:hypothetical protein